MTPLRPLVAILSSTLLLGGSGCSVLFMESPPPEHATLRYFDCTSSRVSPAMDATVAGVAGLAALGSVDDNNNGGVGAAIVGSSIAAGAVASAVYGYVKADRCRKAKHALQERLTLEVLSQRVPPPPFAPGGVVAPPPAAAAPQPPPADPWLLAGPPPPALFPPPGAPPAAAPAPAPEGGAR